MTDAAVAVLARNFPAQGFPHSESISMIALTVSSHPGVRVWLVKLATGYSIEETFGLKVSPAAVPDTLDEKGRTKPQEQRTRAGLLLFHAARR